MGVALSEAGGTIYMMADFMDRYLSDPVKCLQELGLDHLAADMDKSKTKQLRAAAQVFDRKFSGDKPKLSLAEAAAQRLARSSAIQFVFAMEMLQWFALVKDPKAWAEKVKTRGSTSGSASRPPAGLRPAGLQLQAALNLSVLLADPLLHLRRKTKKESKKDKKDKDKSAKKSGKKDNKSKDKDKKSLKEKKSGKEKKSKDKKSKGSTKSSASGRSSHAPGSGWQDTQELLPASVFGSCYAGWGCKGRRHPHLGGCLGQEASREQAEGGSPGGDRGQGWRGLYDDYVKFEIKKEATQAQVVFVVDASGGKTRVWAAEGATMEDMHPVFLRHEGFHFTALALQTSLARSSSVKAPL
eukprot:s3600_g7.t1